MGQEAFAKRQREKARREKAAAKAERRAERREGGEGEDRPETSPAEQSALLAQLAQLHERFDAGEVELDDFLEAKDELTARLHVS